MPRKKLKPSQMKDRVELRLDYELNDKLKDVADEAGISVNQLVQGLLYWAIPQAHIGYPIADSSDQFIHTEKRDEMVWFGEDGKRIGPDDCPVDSCYYFTLDFSSKRAIVGGGLDSMLDRRIEEAEAKKQADAVKASKQKKSGNK